MLVGYLLECYLCSEGLVLILDWVALLTGALWQTRVRHCQKLLFKNRTDGNREISEMATGVVMGGHAGSVITDIGRGRWGVENRTQANQPSS